MEQPHSCLLYIGSVLVDEYGKSKSIEKPMMSMLKVGDFGSLAFPFVQLKAG